MKHHVVLDGPIPKVDTSEGEQDPLHLEIESIGGLCFVAGLAPDLPKRFRQKSRVRRMHESHSKSFQYFSEVNLCLELVKHLSQSHGHASACFDWLFSFLIVH